MFSRLQPVFQRTDNGGLRNRFHRRRSNESGNETITQSEIDELQVAADTLRRQLYQITNKENASNNEACLVATNGMVLLRNDLEDKRQQREAFHIMLEDTKNELSQVEERCTQELEQQEICREDVMRMQEDTDKAGKETINLRAEVKQLTYFQEVVDNETKHRLRADVQNLELEKEMDQIRLRHLHQNQNQLRTELEMLKAERDALQAEGHKQRRDLSEAKMTQDMYLAHQEALAEHLESLGGDPSSTNILFEPLRSLRGMLGRRVSLGRIKQDGNSMAPSKTSKQSAYTTPQQKKQQGQPRFIHPDSRGFSEKSRQSSKKSSSHHVGGIVLGGDTTGGESSDFLRKLPTIFKLGGANNNNEGGNVQEYIAKREREVEFNDDSHSISAISAITIDDDVCTESSSEEASYKTRETIYDMNGEVD